MLKYAKFLSTLRNPIYAGTYVFRRTKTDRCLDAKGTHHVQVD